MRTHTLNSLLKYSMWIALCMLVTTADSHATVVCEVSTSGAPFGSFDVISHERRDTLASINVSCTGDIGESVSYAIALSPGTTLNRKMRSGANLLRYNLYSDRARTQVWGDGMGGSTTLRDSFRISSSPTRRVYTIYGRIPNGQELAQVGAYIDSISVLVSY
jgi:spore coat protein U-like protein